ncbi:metalloreductase STEAP4 [Brachionus plicatilis]|uniref:Metalloreductase STEAP4 n=1 Tax=Brachionus plicatilis TaxID=10195 RepID=A0A3M7RMZ0_BRAPC|nr:metalloreductase STEAP4 [Brachionus plicatilis]
MSEIKIQIEEKKSLNEKISIIGTSDFGISIGKRLLHFGFDVIYGSCDPNLKYLKKCFEEQFTMNRLSVTTISDALHQADSIVFLAVSSDFYENLADQIVESLSRKHKTKNSTILIDASNLHDSSHGKTLSFSNAEKLESLIQKQIIDSKLDHQVNVIKAFNLLNSNSMRQYIENVTKSVPKTVPIAGNDTLSKQKVKDLCAKLGFDIALILVHSNQH